jgi:hypothetical protein
MVPSQSPIGKIVYALEGRLFRIFRSTRLRRSARLKANAEAKWL